MDLAYVLPSTMARCSSLKVDVVAETEFGLGGPPIKGDDNHICAGG